MEGRYLIKKLQRVFVGIIILLLLVGCQNTEMSEQKSETNYRLYYVNKSYTKVVSVPYQPEADLEIQDKKELREKMLEEFLQGLQADPDDPDYRKPIPTDVKILDAYMTGEKLIITFNENYYAMEKIAEILNRAAIVRTLTQIEGIESVSFQINSQVLLDSAGQAVGFMKASDFIDDLGGDINDYHKTTLNLYFSNQTGDKLVLESRELVYSNTISIERLVVEQLISGPASAELRAVLPADMKLINISTKDGVCYVNLDNTFLSGSVNTIEAVPVYAIVNSLVELPNVNKVQILINGETNKKYRETISLDTFFERNLDLIEYTTEGTS